LGLVAETDNDPKRNRIRASIRFGPNMVAGVMNEKGIEKYCIFLTDVYGFRLLDGDAVLNVTNEMHANNTDCCDPEAYEIEVETDTPTNYTEFRFEVAPMVEGERFALANGMMTGVLEDWIDLAFMTSGAFHFAYLVKLATILIICVYAWLE